MPPDADTYDQLAYTYGEEILSLMPPWMLQNPQIAQAFLEEVIESGGTSNPSASSIALERIRQAPEYRQMYDEVFAGNRREDGTLRLTEQSYFARIQGYRDAVSAIDPMMNADVFNQDLPELIMGDVSIDEFQRRVDALYSRVMTQGESIRQFYGENYGLDVTDQGILASLMSSRVGDAVLMREITMAEIAGEGIVRGYNISSEFADMLATDGGMDRDEAKRLFGSADQLLPVLNVLAQRHGDPDDTFDIMELAQANALLDPKQMKRISTLVAQEKSTFTGGKAIEYVSDQAGGVTGLDTV
jgi:hypothetical protein